jgi:hypothetical protein
LPHFARGEAKLAVMLDNISDTWVEVVPSIYDRVANSRPATIFFVVGIILAILSIVLAIRAIRSKPDELYLIERVGFFLSIVFSIVFPLIGLVIALIPSVAPGPTPVSRDTAIQNLRTNKYVQYCVRLVPYSSDQRPRFERLGPPGQLYTFVADYPELQGHTVADAVEMVGGSVTQVTHVFAVIFSRNDYPIIPANARGLLQVIGQIDDAHKSDKQYCQFNVKDRTTPQEWTDLSNNRLPTWAFDKYKSFFPDYCAKAFDFINFSTTPSCRTASSQTAQDYRTAQDYLGTINSDWNPLGFSEEGRTTIDRSACNISNDLDWDETFVGLKGKFGARAFLIQNLKIADLQGRWLVALIDFTDPEHQVIPDLGVRD